MTLKEKLRNSLTGHLSDEKTEVDVNIAEKIAEEFAIGFADWLILKCDYQNHGVFEYLGNEYTNKELLEIYKKEKDYAKCAYCNLENGNHKLSCTVIKVTMLL
jgi:hypothetical protein